MHRSKMFQGTNLLQSKLSVGQLTLKQNVLETLYFVTGQFLLAYFCPSSVFGSNVLSWDNFYLQGFVLGQFLSANFCPKALTY